MNINQTHIDEEAKKAYPKTNMHTPSERLYQGYLREAFLKGAAFVLESQIEQQEPKCDETVTVYEINECLIQASVALDQYGDGDQERQEDLTLSEINDCLEVAKRLASDYLEIINLRKEGIN